MDTLFSLLTPQAFAVAFMVALLAGFIKGMVGFAMPMILISGLSSIIDPQLALAGLILPTVLTNGWQSLRQGPAAAWESVKRFRIFLLVGLVAILISAQMVRLLSPQAMLLLIGVPVSIFVVIQLMGLRLRLPESGQGLIEAGIGGFAGLIGGMSGVWGPPTVLYLTALETPKTEQLRIQGVIYGLGAVALLGAHIGSGVLRSDTAVFSAALLIPALAGMWIGFKVHDRIDQTAFRRVTLIVLFVAALNLVRRGILV
ncbi:MAG: sulfite exporter TauE/SafE family protein [Thalassovita sp.]|nr:sulfite exporter TauE/SafE family protein [Thalassovita sp.]